MLQKYTDLEKEVNMKETKIQSLNKIVEKFRIEKDEISEFAQLLKGKLAEKKTEFKNLRNQIKQQSILDNIGSEQYSISVKHPFDQTIQNSSRIEQDNEERVRQQDILIGKLQKQVTQSTEAGKRTYEDFEDMKDFIKLEKSKLEAKYQKEIRKKMAEIDELKGQIRA